MRDVRRIGWGRGLCGGGRKKSGWGVSWTTAAQDEGEWRRTAKQGANISWQNLIAAEKARAGLRHAVVCPSVKRKTKERIAQRKRARAGSCALVN